MRQSFFVEIEFAGVDFREIENVVDHIKEVLTTLV
jgi:hypothetical protein